MAASRAKVPAKPKRNWARISKLWLPISTLSTATPAVLANEDKSIQWFAEKPAADPVKHTEHARDESGSLQFTGGIDIPTVESEVTPVWWTPAVYVDDRGEPVF